MNVSKIIYQGNLRTSSTHIKSGETIITDAPIDNNGKGEAFSPTDLVTTALASCMLTIMGIKARKNDINIVGISISVGKVMANNPRRISEIHLNFDFKGIEYSEKEKVILRNAAETCPVALSLNNDIKQVLQFNF